MDEKALMRELAESRLVRLADGEEAELSALGVDPDSQTVTHASILLATGRHVLVVLDGDRRITTRAGALELDYTSRELEEAPDTPVYEGTLQVTEEAVEEADRQFPPRRPRRRPPIVRYMRVNDDDSN